MNEEKIELVESVEKLKEDSTKIFKDYIDSNEALMNKLKDTAALLQ